MIHRMGLYEEPFQSIKSQKKLVEVRLNDEKRRKIQTGDKIIFTKVPGGVEQLEVIVINLTIYPSFKEMYTAIPAEAFDSVGTKLEDMIQSTYEIYSKEQEKQFGTLAIEVKYIDSYKMSKRGNKVEL